MKKTNLLAILTLAATPAFLHAQTTSYSDVVGYYKRSFPAGGSLQAVALLKPVLVQGTASSVSGATLNATSLGITSNQLAPSGNLPRYYVEVLDGSRAGYTYDILSNTPSSITVSSSDIANAGATPKFNVRAHTRLSEVFASSTGLTDVNDQVALYNPDGSNSNYLRDSSVPSGWVDSTSGAETDAVIFPNQGFVLTTATSGEITLAGTVKSTSTVVPLYGGKVNIVSLSNPGISAKDIQTTNLGANLPIDSQVTTYLENGSLLQKDALLWVGVTYGGFLDGTTGSAASGVNVAGPEAVIVTVTSDTTWVCPSPIPSN
jgi:hypothetical protein